MTFTTMLAHERASTIVVAVRAVTFVLTCRMWLWWRTNVLWDSAVFPAEREARGGPQGGHTCQT